MIGYLKIPKIDVRLPIYHNTDQSTLEVGIGHFKGSSLPVPGETVHTILSGHTGLPSSKLLTDLVELEVGDTFSIVVLNQIYTYEVDQILVVEPDDTDALELTEGKQYATIITCTPYGINTHRLLVRGELIQNTVNTDVANEAFIVDSSIIIAIIAIPLIIILFVIMINVRNKRNKKKGKEDDESNLKK
jgi:sortase A